MSDISALMPAGADEVSVAIATLFQEHAAAYQALGTQVDAFHAQFVETLSAASGSYCFDLG